MLFGGYVNFSNVVESNFRVVLVKIKEQIFVEFLRTQQEEEGEDKGQETHKL